MALIIVAEENNNSSIVLLEALSICMPKDYTSTDFFLFLVSLYRVPDSNAYLSITIW